MQQMGGCPTAMAHGTDIGQKALVGQQCGCKTGIGELSAQRTVPPPRRHGDALGHGRQVGKGDKQHVVGISTQVAYPLQGRLYIVYQHQIAVFSPEGRQEAHVGPHLAPSMGRYKLVLVGGEGNVVLGIEDM